MSNYGKFFIARNIFESDVWEKLPYFLKIWIWIIGRANYKEVKKGGKVYHRGEFLTSIPEIIEANKWMDGWSARRLSKYQVWRVFEFLRKSGRITTGKTTRGLFIKVLNYDHYQTLPRYKRNSKRNSESNRTATASQHYKRKKEKKEKKLSEVPLRSTSPSPLPLSEAGELNKNVAKVIDYFCDTCEESRGFKPRISRKVEVKMIKDFLKDYSVDDLTDQIAWFLESKECNDLGCTIKIALSAYVFNKWLETSQS